MSILHIDIYTTHGTKIGLSAQAHSRTTDAAGDQAARLETDRSLHLAHLRLGPLHLALGYLPLGLENIAQFQRIDQAELALNELGR